LLLQAALEGLELQKKRIENQIREIRSLVGRRRSLGENGEDGISPRPKRELSPAARKRIASAQKKRWAEYRRASAAEG
jgi:hypothetical protein